MSVSQETVNEMSRTLVVRTSEMVGSVGGMVGVCMIGVGVLLAVGV